MQKTDKMLFALNNMEAAIRDIIKNGNSNQPNVENLLKKYNGKELNRIVGALGNLLSVINDLKYYQAVRHPKIDEIMSIAHSLKLLMDREVYLDFVMHIKKCADLLNKNMKAKDIETLSKFRRFFGSLPSSIKKKVSYCELRKSGKVIYGRSISNYDLVSGYYLLSKYQFKEVRKDYVIENDIDKITKLELILYALKKIVRICESEGYNNIKLYTLELINNYQKELDSKNHSKFKAIKKPEEETINEEEERIIR